MKLKRGLTQYTKKQSENTSTDHVRYYFSNANGNGFIERLNHSHD